jgi:hypothetical protein
MQATIRVPTGGKAKNDRIDAGKLARLLRGGNFPVAYTPPTRRWATRARGNHLQVGPANELPEDEPGRIAYNHHRLLVDARSRGP